MLIKLIRRALRADPDRVKGRKARKLVRQARAEGHYTRVATVAKRAGVRPEDALDEMRSVSIGSSLTMEEVLCVAEVHGLAELAGVVHGADDE